MVFLLGSKTGPTKVPRKEKKNSMRLTSLATLRLYEEAAMLGSHACSSNHQFIF